MSAPAEPIQQLPFAPQQLLHYWFGPGPQFEWRGGFWWKGVDPALGVLDEQGDRLSVKAMAARTDRHVREVYGPVLELLLQAAAEEKFEVPAPLREWLGSVDGKVALVIMMDQLPRNAFRGTERMFALDEHARALARQVLDENKAELPWPHRMFMAVALMHAEDVLQVEAAAYELRLMATELEHIDSKLANRLRETHRQCLQHLSVLRRFGRYPHRNAALGRSSTEAEQEYLRSKKLHMWARETGRYDDADESNTFGDGDEAAGTSTARSGTSGAARLPSSNRRPLRLLVLHGSRQNRNEFAKRTRAVLVQSALGEIAEVVYADAPHLYVPGGDPSRAAEGVDGSGPGGALRCWWNASDVPETMVYRGLNESIAYIDQLFAEKGPFDGILGFSQGGCLAGIIAALQHQVSPLVRHVKVRFVVVISGFFCRDTRPAFADLHQGRGDDLIDIPSFHVWGTSDRLVDNWRSEQLACCFKEKVVVTHDADHYGKAIKQWPISSIVSWMTQFVDREPQLTIDTPIPQADVSGMTFEERLNGTFQLNKTAFRSTNHTAPLVPLGLSHPTLLEAPCWQKIVAEHATVRSSTITPQAVDDFVSSAFVEHSADTDSLVADLMLLAWCTYPYPHTTPAKQRKSVRRALADEQGAVFLWLWAAVFKHARDLCIAEYLRLIGAYGSWHDYEKLDLLAVVGTFVKEREVRPSERFELPSDAATQLHQAIVAVFAEQLDKDLQVARSIERKLDGVSENDESRWAQMVKIRLQMSLDETNQHVSACFKFVPRAGLHTDKKTKLATDVAVKLLALAHPGTNDVPGGGADQAIAVRAKRHFQRAVSTLRELYTITHPSDEAIKRERAFQQSDWNRRMYNIHSEEQLAELLAAPLSDFVVNPAPDPVDVTPLEEFVPIHSFLRSGQPLPQTPDGNVTFTKGTICQDGRLDLCKQVVGPRGVDDLMRSLELDANQQRMIQHLLLGNNICGDELALKAAELIRKGASALTTYYIAGNCMTGEGIEPLCDALATEKLVKQLWLKRNPLRATGARHLGRMLTTNTTLQVLDLATTGLLNEGFQALLNGLRQNATLRHLYLAGNGMDTSGLAGVSEYLEHHCQLETLSVGCNRLGDAGAIIFAEGLRRNTTLKRFEMASCGIGSKGGQALADMLTTNTTLLHLDIGCLTMTVALKEVPNRIGVQGAKAFADALRVNSTLRSLVLFHNGIYQEGVDALRAVLCDEERRNTSLVHLELEQLGVPHNEMSREDIRYALKRNYLALTDAQRTEAEEAVDPRHHREIISVYRMNGSYKGTTVLSSTIASALEPNSGFAAK